MIIKSALVTIKKKVNGKLRERRLLFDEPEIAKTWVHEMGKQGWESKIETLEYYRRGEIPDVPPTQNRMGI